MAKTITDFHTEVSSWTRDELINALWAYVQDNKNHAWLRIQEAQDFILGADPDDPDNLTRISEILGSTAFHNMNNSTFDAMDEETQWQWLICNRWQVAKIGISEDKTLIVFKGYSKYTEFKADIGNQTGAKILLEALGFEVDYF